MTYVKMRYIQEKRDIMAEKRNYTKKGVGWGLILSLQVIASGILLFSIYKLGILPTKYFSVIVIFLIVLCIIFAFLMKPNIKKEKKQTGKLVAKIISILVSIILLAGCIYIQKGNDVVETITSANTQTTRYSVFVLVDNIAEDITTLDTTNVFTCNMNDRPSHISEVSAAFETAAPSITLESVSDYDTLSTSLYDGTTKAILVNEAYKGLIEEKYPNFETETKIIWHYDIVEEISEFAKEADVTNEAFTIYISGIDTSGPISTVSRSDVNMLVTVNPVSKQILLTNIPRDYFVPMANSGIKDKLTHAGLGGVENSAETIENFLGIEINYYARVNFTSLQTMVDALGGITVDSPYAFRSLHGNYWFSKGLNEMDGHKALCFARERYSLPGGDRDRGKNQQLVITAMLKKAMSPTIIYNYTEVLSAIKGAFETNMSADDITNLIKMQLVNMSSWTFKSQSLDGYGATLTGGALAPNQALYYMIPYEEDIENCSNLINQMTYKAQ